jgi:hypothetical protein
MSTEANALPVALSSYLQTDRGLTVSAEIRQSLCASLAVEPLKSLIVTIEHVHQLRGIIELAAIARAEGEGRAKVQVALSQQG